MARAKKVSYASANIVLHPHSQDRYSSLFSRARELKSVGRININRRARIGHLDHVDLGDGLKAMYGQIFFYSQIDANQKWLDDSLDEAADDDGLKILRKEIQRLHPEFRFMRFVLIPETHNIYFETRNEDRESFTPGTVKKAFDKIFNHPELIEEFGEVEFTIMPTTDALSKILHIADLSKLIIDLHRPNPDEWETDEAFMAATLDKQYASRRQETLTKMKGAETLEPDDDTKKIADVASRNGSVKGVGYENNKKVEVSTLQHPLIEIRMLNEDEESPKGILYSVAKMNWLRRRR